MTDHLDAPASDWVARWAALIRPGGATLDLACGTGRHSRLLARLGFEVDAVDRDPALFPDPPAWWGATLLTLGTASTVALLVDALWDMRRADRLHGHQRPHVFQPDQRLDVLPVQVAPPLLETAKPDNCTRSTTSTARSCS